MNERIEGKVAAIINDASIIINCGWLDGVEEDMRFAIFEIGENIIDPETGEDMGNFELVKAKVKVVHIQEKMSNCWYIYPDEMSDVSNRITKLTLKNNEKNVYLKKVMVGDNCREYDSSYEKYIERNPLGTGGF